MKIHSQESPSGEKLFETTDYETANGVSRSNRISTTVDDLSTHPDGFQDLNKEVQKKDVQH